MATNVEMELSRLWSEIQRLERELGRVALPPGSGGFRPGAVSVADNTGVIDSESAGVGAAATGKRSDAKDGLKLVGNPGDATEAVAGGNFNASLEFVKDDAGPVVRRGARVKVNTTDSPSDLRTLEVQTGGLGVKISGDADNILAVSNGVTVAALASTSKRGLAPSATAPAAGLRNVLAIDNTETAYKNAALFDATNPAALGAAAPGTAMTAARRDHVHAALAGGHSFTPVDGSSNSLTAGGAAWTNVDLSATYAGAVGFVLAISAGGLEASFRCDGHSGDGVQAPIGNHCVVVGAANGVFEYFQDSGGSSLYYRVVGYWA